MSVENFLKSMAKGYLHFQRVDTYRDFPNADESDGEQLPLDKIGNSNSKFAKDQSYTAVTYYDNCRSRTYAYCLSLENSDYIWKEYGNQEESKGKICLVFEFGKLRQTLNQSLPNITMVYGDTDFANFFHINYGIVEYIKKSIHQLNLSQLPNPIQYTYIKDEEKYGQEKELRISLSALGIGKFALKDGRLFEFPPSIQLPFDFKMAFTNGAIEQILHVDPELLPYLRSQMEQLHWFGDQCD